MALSTGGWRWIGSASLLMVALTLALGAPSEASIAPAPGVWPACEVVAFSSAFEKDLTGLCAVFRAESVKLFSTTDGGHSWQERAARGVVSGTQGLGDVMFSPLYERDKTIYLHHSQSLYASTDMGESFTLIDGRVFTDFDPTLTPYVEPASQLPLGPLGQERVVFAYIAPAKLDPPLQIPVAGSPDYEKSFLASPDPSATPRYLISGREVPEGPSDPDPPGQLALYECDAQLTCAKELFAFPVEYQDLVGAWIVPSQDGAEDTLYVAVSAPNSDDPDTSVMKSTDGGKNFEVWQSVEDLLAPIEQFSTEATPTIELASNDSFPGQLYLRVSSDLGLNVYMDESTDHINEPPTEQLFFSPDDGHTWRRVGASYWKTSPKFPGNLPWNRPGPHLRKTALYFLDDGTLFALGDRFPPTSLTDGAIFCSSHRPRARRPKPWKPFCS